MSDTTLLEPTGTEPNQNTPSQIVQAEPTQTAAVQAESEQNEALQAVPVQTKAAQADPEQTEAAPAEPEQTEAAQAEPEQTEAAQAEPKQTALERKVLYIPSNAIENEFGEIDHKLKFIFVRTQAEPIPQISMEISVNPEILKTRAPSIEALPPKIYHFPVTRKIELKEQNKDYSIKGSVSIIDITPPHGQFDQQSKNFYLDLTFDLFDQKSLEIEGAFALLDK